MFALISGIIEKKKTLSIFICPNRTVDSFGHFEDVLPFCNEKNSKASFKKKNENNWKHKYDYLYVYFFKRK